MSEIVFLLSANIDIQKAYEYHEAYQDGRGAIILPAYPVSAGPRAPDASGFYVGTASVTMVHAAGVFGVVVAGIIV